jgi:hypothetical protein
MDSGEIPDNDDILPSVISDIAANPVDQRITTQSSTIGREGELLKPRQYAGSRIAVFTSGGDSQGWLRFLNLRVLG